AWYPAVDCEVLTQAEPEAGSRPASSVSQSESDAVPIRSQSCSWKSLSKSPLKTRFDGAARATPAKHANGTERRSARARENGDGHMGDFPVERTGASPRVTRT